MVSETEKLAFKERVGNLLVDPSKVESVDVSLPSGDKFVLRNEPGKQNSVQVYSAITDNNGWITPEAATRGLEIYGEELRAEAEDLPGKHPAIDSLELIALKFGKARSVIRTVRDAKPLPFSEDLIRTMVAIYGTPFIAYDEEGIRGAARTLNKAFREVPNGFRNFFAVKACANPYILSILKEEGMGADCSSDTELVLSRGVGMQRRDMMFTSNNTAASEFQLARDIGAIINFDDITHVPFFEKYVGHLPRLAFFRFNPGDERVGNSIIGNPSEAKYGIGRDQVEEMIRRLKEGGVEDIGIHTMIASNEGNAEYFAETGRMMFKLARMMNERFGVNVWGINLGGGIGVPYRPEHRAPDVTKIGKEITEEFWRQVDHRDIDPRTQLFMENGRFVTGPHGFLVSRARHVMEKHKDYVGIDATCMSNLPRPAIYAAYHHATVLGKPNDFSNTYDLVDSLCENNGKFAVDRALPRIEMGDLVVIHEAGAHAYAMTGNYNGKMRCAEVLVHSNGEHEMIRRAEEVEDLFATFNFPGSKFRDLAR